MDPTNKNSEKSIPTSSFLQRPEEPTEIQNIPSKKLNKPEPKENFFLVEDAGESGSDSESQEDSEDSLNGIEGFILESTSNKRIEGITLMARKKDEKGMEQTALMQKYLKYTKTPQARGNKAQYQRQLEINTEITPNVAEAGQKLNFGGLLG